MKARREEESHYLTPTEIYRYLNKYVIGQEKAKRTVAIAAYNHQKRIIGKKFKKVDLPKKSNILLIGPTGCGKTHLARNLARVLDLPLTIVDVTEYTEAGYYGKDVEVMVAELLFKTGGRVDETQRGIIFVDEIDKIARRSHGPRTGAGSRDIGGEGVQQALLKLLEGSEIFVPINVTQHWSKHDFVLVDTSEILFVCAGTFSDMLRMKRGDIGFVKGEYKAPSADFGRKMATKDLLEYGMLAEFLGRLPVVVELEPLSDEDLLKILTKPPDSILKEYKQLLALDGITLNFTEGALREIVTFAVRTKIGARGLRSIMEEVMHDIMFDAPSYRGHKTSITKRYVRDRLRNSR